MMYLERMVYALVPWPSRVLRYFPFSSEALAAFGSGPGRRRVARANEQLSLTP